MNLFKRFRKNQSGATAIEYGLIAAIIAVGIIAAATTLGPVLSDLFGIKPAVTTEAPATK